MLDEKGKIISSADNKLKIIKEEIQSELKKINSELEDCNIEDEKIKGLTGDRLKEIYTPEINRIFSNYEKFSAAKDVIRQLEKTINATKEQSQTITLFDAREDGIEGFIVLMSALLAFNADITFNTLNTLSKLTGVKLTIKQSDIANFTNRIFLAQSIHRQSLTPDRRNYNGNPLEVVDRIKQTFNYDEKFFKKFLDTLEEIDDTVDKKCDEHLDKIKEIRDKEVSKRFENNEKRKSELMEKAKEYEAKLEKIDETHNLANEYFNKSNQEVILELTSSLSLLGALKERDVKLLRYVKKEKEKKKKKEENTSKVEEKVIEKQPELDLEYYRRPSTQNIICFLGKDDDSFLSDLDNCFDNSSRPLVIKKLYELFNNLYSNKDFIVQTGGNPHEGTTDKVRKLLDRPFDFDYRRYGTGKDQYRIHAITRYSELLKNLGYGNGNIIFFGAVGVNDTTEKSFTYDRLGRRAVDKASNNGLPSKLRSSFDGIEHITRGYVPVDLLSNYDREKFEQGLFKGKSKGNVDKTVESHYISYSLLDDISKGNVRAFLEDYFEKQALRMFQIINEYNNIKGNNLG